jgi:hypothetical protein
MDEAENQLRLEAEEGVDADVVEEDEDDDE